MRLINFKLSKAFTLIEVIITVILVGVISSLALVNFNRVIEQGYCGQAQANLRLIYFAREINRIKGKPPAQDGQMTSLALMNTRLNLSIPDDGRFRYTYVDFFNPLGNPLAIRRNGPVYTCGVRSGKVTCNTSVHCGALPD